MNILLSLFLFYLTCGISIAQPSWNVVTALGSYANKSNVYVHSSIGQPLSTSTANHNLYSQGFQFSNGSLNVAILNYENVIHARVYPNPISDVCYLELVENFVGDIKIKTIDGVVLYRQVVYSKFVELDLSQFNSGLYLLDGHSLKFNFTLILIVQH